LRLGGLSTTTGVPNRYRYNGKELHDELGLGWYDYGFRWYDPAVARFVSVDPLAEDFAELTTYQYAGNSPIANIDLDGLEPWPHLSPKVRKKIVQGAKNVATAIVAGVFAPFNMIANTHAAGNTTDPATKAKFQEAAKENAKEVAVDLMLLGAGNEVFGTMKGMAKTASKGVNEGAEAGVKVGTTLSKRERLGKFMEKLSEADGVSNPEDALELINKTLDNVEDAYSGVKKNPNAASMPNRDDGRMYGILDDTFVKKHKDGSLTARTKGNKIEIGANGSIRILSKDGKKVFLEKPGITN